MSSDGILEERNTLNRHNYNNEYFIGKNLVDTITTYGRSVKNSDFKKCLSELNEYTNKPKLISQNFKEIIKILLLNIENASVDNAHTLIELLVAFIRDLKKKIIPILPDLIEFFRVLIIESSDIKFDYKNQLLRIFTYLDDWPIINFQFFHKLFETWLITPSSSPLHSHSSYVIGITLKRFNHDSYRDLIKHFVDYSISLSNSESYYNYLYSVGLALAHSLYSSDGSLSYNSTQLVFLGLSVFDDLKTNNKDDLLYKELLYNSLFTIYLNAFYHLKCINLPVDFLLKIIKNGLEKYIKIVLNDLSVEPEILLYKQLESHELSIAFATVLSTNLYHSSTIASFFSTALIGLVYWSKPLTDSNILGEIEEMLNVLINIKSLNPTHLIALINNLYLPNLEFLSDVITYSDSNYLKYSNIIQMCSKLIKQLILNISQGFKVINDFTVNNILIHFARRTLFVVNKIKKYFNKFPEALDLVLDVYKLVENIKMSDQITASCLLIVNDLSQSVPNFTLTPHLHNFLLTDGIKVLNEFVHCNDPLQIKKISSIVQLVGLNNCNNNLFLENPFRQSFFNIFKILISLTKQVDCIDLIFKIISIYDFDYNEVDEIINKFSDKKIPSQFNFLAFGIDFVLSSSNYFYSGVYHFLSINKQLIKKFFSTERGALLLNDFFKQSISKLIIPIRQHQLLILDCLDEELLFYSNTSNCIDKLKNLISMDFDIINSRAKVNSILRLAKDAIGTPPLLHIIVINIFNSFLLYKFQPLWAPSVESIILLIKENNELKMSLFGSDTLNYLFSLYHSFIKSYVNHIVSGSDIYFTSSVFVNDTHRGLHITKPENIQNQREGHLDIFNLIKSKASDAGTYRFNMKKPFFYPIQSKIHSLYSFDKNINSHEEFTDLFSIFENFNLIVPSIIIKLGQNKDINYYHYTIDLLELMSLLLEHMLSDQLGPFLVMINSILNKKILPFDNNLHNKLYKLIISLTAKLVEIFSKLKANVKVEIINFLSINHPKTLKNSADLINLINGKEVKTIINNIINSPFFASNILFNKIFYKIIISILYTFDKNAKSDRLVIIDFLNSSQDRLFGIYYELFSDIIILSNNIQNTLNNLDDVVNHILSEYNNFYEILKSSNLVEINEIFVLSGHFVHFIDWFNKNITKLNIFLRPISLFLFKLIYNSFLIYLGKDYLPLTTKQKLCVKIVELLTTIAGSLDLINFDSLLTMGLLQPSILKILDLTLFKFNKLFCALLSLVSACCKLCMSTDFIFSVLDTINRSFEKFNFENKKIDFREKFSSQMAPILELYNNLFSIKNDFEKSQMDCFLKNTLSYWSEHQTLNNIEFQFISIAIEGRSNYSDHLFLCLLTSKNIINISFKDKDVKLVSSNLKMIIQCLSNLSQAKMTNEIIIEINKMISIYLTKCRDLKCRKLACEILSIASRYTLNDINLSPFDSIKKNGYSVDALDYVLGFPNNICLWRYFVASVLESLYCIRTHTLIIKLNIDDSIKFLDDFTQRCVLTTSQSTIIINSQFLTPFILPLLSNFFFFIRTRCDWIQEDMVFLKSIGIFFTNILEKALAMMAMGTEAESKEGTDLLIMLRPLPNSIELLINRNQTYTISTAIEIVQRICSIITKYKNYINSFHLLDIFGDLASTMERTEGSTSFIEYKSVRLSFYNSVSSHFLFDLNSVKRSKRSLAIKKMAEMICYLNFNTLMKFGVPLAKYYLKQPKASAKTFSASLADACADFLSVLISKSPTYKGLISSILDIKLSIGKSRIFRIIVNGLKKYQFKHDDGHDSFLFDLLRTLRSRVTDKISTKKGEEEVCIPWACSLYGHVCYILESIYAHTILDEVMYITRRLIVILKSRDINIRRTARDGLARLSTNMSPDNLVAVVEELNYSMDNGYKVPVLALTVTRLVNGQTTLESTILNPLLSTISKELRFILESDVLEKGIGDSKSSIKVDEGRRHHYIQLCNMMGSKLDPVSAFGLYDHFINTLNEFKSTPKFLPKLLQMVEYTCKGISTRPDMEVLELSNKYLTTMVSNLKASTQDFDLKEFYIKYSCSLLDIIRSCLKNVGNVNIESIVYLFASGNTNLRDRAARCLLPLLKMYPNLIDTYGTTVMHVCFDYFSNIQSHRDLSRTHLVLLKLFTLLQGTNLNEMQAKLVGTLLSVSLSNLSIVNLRIPSLQMIRYILSRKSLASALDSKLIINCITSITKLALENRGESNHILENSKKIILYSMEIAPVDIFLDPLISMLIKNVSSSPQVAFTLLSTVVSSACYPNKSIYTEMIFFTSFSAMSSNLDKLSSVAVSDVITNIFKKWPNLQAYLIKTSLKLVEESYNDALISAFVKTSFLISKTLDSVRETSAILVQTNYQILNKIASQKGNFYSKIVFVILKSFKNIIKLLEKSDEQFIIKRKGVAEYLWKYIDFITTEGYKFGYTAVEASSLSCFIIFFNLFPTIVEYSKVVSVFAYCLDKLGFSKNTEKQDKLREAIVEYLCAVFGYLFSANATEIKIKGNNYFERLQKKSPVEIFQSSISWLCFLARRHLGNIKKTFNRVESIISILYHVSTLPHIYTDDMRTTLAKIVMCSRIMLNCNSMALSIKKNKRKNDKHQDINEKITSISSKANEILIYIEKKMDSIDKSQDFIKIVQNTNTVSTPSYSLSLDGNRSLELLGLLLLSTILSWQRYVKCLNTHKNVKHTLNLVK